MIFLSIKRLRKLAELNLYEECYRKYSVLIEPAMKRWLSRPLSDWRIVESLVDQMIMRQENVFKDDKLIYVRTDENDSIEKISDKVDLKVFKRIKRWGSKKKLNFNKDRGVLQAHSFRLLDKARKIRNKIHSESYEFSDQDLALFRSANRITTLIRYATMFEKRDDVCLAMKSKAEYIAKGLLDLENREERDSTRLV